MAIAVLFAAFLLWGLFFGQWIVARNGVAQLLDFTPMWLAGREALAGKAAAVYDAAHFSAVQAAFVGAHPSYYRWPYPPIYFLPATLLAMLPYFWAFLLWQAGTLTACAAVVRRIVRDYTAAILVLAFPLTTYNVILGQNGFLTASLLGGSLLLLGRRPLTAGALLGCLAYKPQFALVLPLLYIVSGRWRAIASAVLTTTVLVAFSLLAFGAAPWRAFPTALWQRADTALVRHDLEWKLFQSVFGLARTLGISAGYAWALHLLAAAIAVIATLMLWRRPCSCNLKAAAAATASLIVTPYLFAYDLAVIVIPAAFLARDQVERGSTWRERSILIALFIEALALFFTNGKLPIGPLLTVPLFGLILTRASENRSRSSGSRIRICLIRRIRKSGIF